MSNLLTAYAGSSATTISASIQGLAAGSAWQSAVVDNSSNRYVDAQLRITTKGTSGSTVTLDVYAYGSAEATTPSYTDGASGSDGSFTAANRINAPLVGQVVLNGASTVVAGPWSVAAAFGGTLPQKWGLIFVNNSANTGALDSTAGNHSIAYQGVFFTIV